MKTVLSPRFRPRRVRLSLDSLGRSSPSGPPPRPALDNFEMTLLERLSSWPGRRTDSRRTPGRRPRLAPDPLPPLVPGSQLYGWLQAHGRTGQAGCAPPSPNACGSRSRASAHATRRRWLAGLRCRRLASGGARTAINKAELKLRRQEGTAPQLFLDVAVAHGHGLAVGLSASGPAPASELRHLEDMVPDLPPGSPWSWPTPALPATLVPAWIAGRPPVLPDPCRIQSAVAAKAGLRRARGSIDRVSVARRITNRNCR